MEPLNRFCFKCGKELEIVVVDNKTISGGHYFGIHKEGGVEYENWLCEECYAREYEESVWAEED